MNLTPSLNVQRSKPSICQVVLANCNWIRDILIGREREFIVLVKREPKSALKYLSFTYILFTNIVDNSFIASRPGAYNML